jgi:hypothetical protein
MTVGLMQQIIQIVQNGPTRVVIATEPQVSDVSHGGGGWAHVHKNGVLQYVVAEAVPFYHATKTVGITPDVVFIRNDFLSNGNPKAGKYAAGWSLGARYKDEQAARDLWASDWVGMFDCNTGEFIYF